MIHSSYLKAGMRVVVIAAPDWRCDHDIVYGEGVIVGIRNVAEVKLDNGNGGFFSLHMLYPILGSQDAERFSWREVSGYLRSHGWELRYRPADGLPPYEWRSPAGVSGSDYRSGHFDSPPEAVMQDAYKAGIVDFTHLVRTGEAADAAQGKEGGV